MIIWKLWIYYGCFLTAAVATESTIHVNEKDIIDVRAGDTFVIRTWLYRGTPLYVTIAKDNKTLMTVSFTGSHDNMADDKKTRLTLNYNDTGQELSLLLCNINMNDEGLYQIHESIQETSNDPFKRVEGRWKFQLNVFNPDEIQRGNVGENTTIMEFKMSEVLIPLLYHYEQFVALMFHSGCDVSNTSHLYGRLKCIENRKKSIYNIEIQNVTQRDAGLYKMVNYGLSETERCFANITDKPISAMVGENVTFGWFYNQQGMKRTLRIIHPNEGVMMILQPSNNSTIKSNFHHRLLYSGDISISYLSFSLLNLIKSDTGVYTIETRHGNSIPGRKQLIVQDIMTSSTLSIATLYRSSTENPTNSLYGQPSSLRPDITDTSIPSIVALYTSSTESASKGSYGHLNSSRPEENTINVQQNGASTFETVSVPIYLLPVIIGAVVVFNLMICCLIWIRRKNNSGMEPDRRHALEECDSDLYITPIGVDRPLPMPLMKDGRASHSNTAQNEQFDSSLRLLHRAPSLCMDGYEMIDISRNDDPESTLNNEENIYESTETSDTPIQDTIGYLTVLGVLETSL